MIIRVKVVPNSKKDGILRDGDFYKIYLKSRPSQGEANKELIGNLSEFFSVSKSKIKIVKGLKSRNKVIEIA